ncbi:glutathione S-transferase C-terminal domain-containing protein [Sphingomonas sp. MMS24-JH45]
MTAHGSTGCIAARRRSPSRRRWCCVTAGSSRPSGGCRKPRTIAQWFGSRLKSLDRALAGGREWLCAGRFTGADISVGYALLLARTLHLDERWSDAVRDWRRLSDRPGSSAQRWRNRPHRKRPRHRCRGRRHRFADQTAGDGLPNGPLGRLVFGIEVPAVGTEEGLFGP